MTPSKPRRVKLDDTGSSLTELTQAAGEADDRFGRATAVLGSMPNGIDPVLPERQGPLEDVAAPKASPATASANVVQLRQGGARGPVLKVERPEDLMNLAEGDIIDAPLALVDLNPLSPRAMYTSETVDKITVTFSAGQDDAAHGYIEDGRVKLIDGGTRWHAAQATTKRLQVKLEAKPATKLALYLRARELNETRSATTALDFALTLKRLLDEGVVPSQKDLTQSVMGPGGKVMSPGTVNRYLRIATALPESVQLFMASSEETSGYSALYELSELFAGELDDKTREERTTAALEIAEQIREQRLGKEKIQKLVKARLQGPPRRERSSVHPLHLAGHKGHIKLFSKKGKIDLSLQGLDEARLDSLRIRLEETLKAFLSESS